MKNKRNVFLLLTLLLLAGCSNNNSDDSSLPPGSSSSSEPGISESSSEGSSSSESSSEELLPISDPDVPGLERSEVWPSEALYGFLRYTDMFNMPELTSETSFHHGLYNDELFYRVLTRVRSADELAKYQTILETENDFIFTLDEFDYLRGETYYGEVQLLLTIEPFGKFFDIAFDFFDGEKYVPKGLVAVDNVAFFNLRNREAVVKRSPEQVKWEVKPVTFTVSKGSAGYPVGNTNYQHISNPLRVYAGNILKFAVDNPQLYIKEIKILSSSGYADELIDEGEFDTAALDIDVTGDWINIVPSGKISDLTYTRENVTGVGQVRLLNITVTLAKK